MGEGTTRSRFGGDPDCFHQFILRSAMAQCRFRVPFDSVRTLRDVRHRDGNELLDLYRERPFGEYLLTECLERFFSFA
jgi:hypothetical protein